MRYLLLVVALVGCAHIVPPTASTAPADRYVRVSFDTAWHRTLTFFTDNHVPIANVDRASGLLVSSQFTLPYDDLKAWADCGQSSQGGTALAALEAVHNIPRAIADFNVVEQGAGDSTAVRVSISLTVTARTPFGETQVACISNGHFEQALLARLGGSA